MSDSSPGCIPIAVSSGDIFTFPVIAKGENPGVLAVKYRYLSSSLNRLVGSCSHVLLLNLFRVIEDRSIFLSCTQAFSTLKQITGFSMFFSVAYPPFPTQIFR
ncbi:hypothetical protein EO98_15050 [Methanosarcina sp. 2.H.T.1A.6]|nr:hypothetical protein EO94_00600 [Methanosarcina sp. 2.H.T.1A.3]KKG17138.1 hypothetical protein EO97_20235 [Methanosarcina sp. 2.H.T.1A.15]KKG22825.1 hypothetical protein EO98_15050 [Methanosarcina sp. 2.H.T.1A.6]KKG24445.1 hypothetical protein EO96_14815 [Methanosarcina sp. 2.H.T.1A.8]